MLKKKVENKKKRGSLARKYLRYVLFNPQHKMYTASDIQFAHKLNVSRLTVINIRKEIGVKSRKGRIVDLLRRINTSEFTIKELAVRLMLKYLYMYKLVKSLGLATQPGKKPIKSLLEYQLCNRDKS